MYTIFINDAALYFTDDAALKDSKNFFVFTEVDLEDVLNTLESSTLSTAYIYAKDIHVAFDSFKTKFHIIEASGGLVYNEHDEILWIYRNDCWDLPKGKIEKGESKKTAAIREVEEECGIKNVQIRDYLNTTYHIYEHKKKRILKVTYWYRMYTEHQVLIPQIEEGITKAAWLNDKTMKEALQNTYGNIKLLLHNL